MTILLTDSFSSFERILQLNTTLLIVSILDGSEEHESMNLNTYKVWLSLVSLVKNLSFRIDLMLPKEALLIFILIDIDITNKFVNIVFLFLGWP